MTVTLTAFGDLISHPRELLQALRSEICQENSVHFICYDGQISSSVLLLAAASPLIRELGRQQKSSCDCEDISLLLPDFSVQEITAFLTVLNSVNGPTNQHEWTIFTQFMQVFGQDQKIKKELLNDEEDDEEELEWLPEQYEITQQPTKKSFKKSGKFSEEIQNCYDESRRIFVCHLCGTERKRSDRLALHLQWHEDHPGENYQTRNNCKICGRFNATFFMLKMHMSRMHSNTPKTFKCQYEGCDKAFRFKGELKIHGMTHSKERNFVCSECGERFRSKGQVELHAIRRHNPDTKPTIPCEECGKLFRIQADLRNHLSRTHRARQERKHRCHDCDLTFRSEKSLLSHMALHDPERPLQCSRCTLRYKNKDALVAHEKTHDNAQYACEFCTIAFKRKDNLKRHIRSKHQTMSMIDKLMLNNVNNHQLLIPPQ